MAQPATMRAGDTGATAAVPRLELHGVSKSFGGRTVLRDIALTVRPGELHGIIGQNGSGKSTLAKIISGYHAPDEGAAIAVDGAALHLPVRLRDLRRASVSIVYQDLGLIPTASVVQNVRIGAMRPGRLTGRVDWKREKQAAADALERLGFARSLDTRVETLTPADKARVAVARALQDHEPGRGLIVFDESTRALPLDALADFYGTVRQLLADGTSVLLIGHRLGEILEYCHRVSVLRDGGLVVGGLETTGLGEDDLARHMLGRALSDLSFAPRAGTPAPPVRLRGLASRGTLAPLDLDVGAGEVVGLTGLPGSGFEAVPYLVAGAQAPDAGTLELEAEQTKLATATTTSMLRRGVALVPENRLRDGLDAEHDVLANITLPWLARHGRPWALGRGWRRRQAAAVMDEMGVVPRDPGVAVARLSGGNQQKVLLGKWLAGKPRLLLVHEPTQAVDVKARQDLLKALHRVGADGTAVVMASTEVADLAVLCDRVLVFRDGAVSHTLEGDFDEHAILAAIYRRPSTPTPAKDDHHA